MKKHCQSERTIRERELRKQRGKNRRFNEPLKAFIERKYPEIFNEYVELYNFMESESPNRRNLTTSTTFKKWLAANPIKESTTIQTIPSTGQSSSTSPLLIPQLLLEPLHLPSKVQEDEPCTDIITLAFQEALAPLPHTAESIQPESEADYIADLPLQEAFGHLPPLSEVEVPLSESNDINRIDDILNEIMEDRSLRNLLERADVDVTEDEGIVLNHFDEIAMDIEPFDFNFEVEPFDF